VTFQPVSHSTFYRDVSKAPAPGDEFVDDLLQDIPSGFELCVTRGAFQLKYKKHRYPFATLEKARRAYRRACEGALHKGFKIADPSPLCL
jgi:hypothetical protein